jgi:ABC-type oligopeptide transport system substrate-binding subunit
VSAAFICLIAMDLFTCTSGNNFTSLCEAKYDANVTSATRLLDESKRQALYDEAQTILLEDKIAIVPIFREHNLYLVAKRVQGFTPNAMNDYRFEDIRLK